MYEILIPEKKSPSLDSPSSRWQGQEDINLMSGCQIPNWPGLRDKFVILINQDLKCMPPRIYCLLQGCTCLILDVAKKKQNKHLFQQADLGGARGGGVGVEKITFQ